MNLGTRQSEPAPSPVEETPAPVLGLAEVEAAVEAFKVAGASEVACRFGGGCSKKFAKPLAECETPSGLNRLKR